MNTKSKMIVMNQMNITDKDDYMTDEMIVTVEMIMTGEMINTDEISEMIVTGHMSFKLDFNIHQIICRNASL